MRNEFDITIITPTLNASRFISKCIRTIQNQKYIKIQHIIVDGGSTDKTIEIIRSFRNVEIHELKNKSIYESLNYGFKFARSSLIGFLNSDDDYTSNDILYKIVKLHPKFNYQIIYGNCRFISSKRKCLYKLIPHKNMNYFLAKLRIFNISHPSWFITKEAFEKLNGYDTKLKYISDCDLIIRALKDENIKFSYINLDISNFMLHESNASRSPAAYREFNSYNKSSFFKILNLILRIILYIKDPFYFLYISKRFVNYILFRSL